MNSVGFPNRQPNQPIVAPQPPKPKTWFTGILLLAIIGYVGYMVWDNYFRTSAYGVVEAKIIDVAPPYNGTIVSIHIKEGDRVEKGQVLATIENIEFLHQYEAAKESLALNSVQLNAQLARLKLEYAFRMDANIGTLVNYYELVALVAQQESHYNQSRDMYTRGAKLLKEAAIPVQDVNILRFSMIGYHESVKELKDGVKTAKKRVESLEKLYDKDAMLANWQEQLKPLSLKIEHGLAEVERFKKKVELGKILAPVSGIVVKRYHHTGEQCDPKITLFSVVEDNSQYVILYVSQDAINNFSIGQTVVLISPVGEINCKVDRFGDRHEPAPDSIKRHYKAGQFLLPIHMQMSDKNLRYGTTVRLPYLGK